MSKCSWKLLMVSNLKEDESRCSYFIKKLLLSFIQYPWLSIMLLLWVRLPYLSFWTNTFRWELWSTIEWIMAVISLVQHMWEILTLLHAAAAHSLPPYLDHNLITIKYSASHKECSIIHIKYPCRLLYECSVVISYNKKMTIEDS